MTIRENNFTNYQYSSATAPIYSSNNGQLDNNQLECTVANIHEIVQRQNTHVDGPKSIKIWSKSDFLNWIATNFMSSDGVDSLDLSLENFYKLDQSQLSDLLNNMDIDKFKTLDPEYGELMHTKLLEYENKIVRRTGSYISCDSTSSDSSMSDSDSLPFIPLNHQSSLEFDRIGSFNVTNRIKDGRIAKPNQNQNKPDKKTKDCVHVWQFCRDLLKDSNYNPTVIEWVDKKQLIFKITAKETIAYLWGLKKNRKNPEKMTYENMSRGMRHSRVASEYFRIPDKKYKKKFVYQFGDKAIENCDYLRSLKLN